MSQFFGGIFFFFLIYTYLSIYSMYICTRHLLITGPDDDGGSAEQPLLALNGRVSPSHIFQIELGEGVVRFPVAG